jgi:long-chain fatty acid transport protein
MGTIRTSLSGWSFLGAQLGLFYKPIDPLRLGLSYRTKVTADLDGETTAPSPMGEVSLDTTSEFSTPHKFTLGASYDVNEKLLLALDAKYILYADSNKELSTTTTIPMVGEQTQTIPFDWKNVFGVAVGAEYHIVSSVPLRLGYNLSTSATPEETAGIFVTPPGLVHGFHAGAGLDLKNWAFDIGGAYAIVGSDVDDSTQGFAGHYAMNVMILSLGATYRM